MNKDNAIRLVEIACAAVMGPDLNATVTASYTAVNALLEMGVLTSVDGTEDLDIDLNVLSHYPDVVHQFVAGALLINEHNPLGN